MAESAFEVADLYRQQAEQSFGHTGWIQIDRSTLGQFNPDDISIETYDKMLKDSHLGAAFDALRLSVLSVDWNINYTGKDPVMTNEIVPWLERQLKNVNSQYGANKGIDKVMWEMMTAMAYGYAVAEVVLAPPTDTDNRIQLRKLKVIEPFTITRFKTDQYSNLEGVYQTAFGSISGINSVGGRFLPKEKLLVWSYHMQFGHWWGQSDLRRIYQNWFAKQFIMRFWNIAIEKYALPFAVGKTGNNADLPGMLADLKKLQKNSVVALSQDKEIEFLKGVVDRDAFVDAIEYHNRSMMTGLLFPQALLENTSTGGAFSQSKTQQNIFMLRVRSIQRDLEAQVSQVIKELVDLNYKNVQGEYPTFNFEEPDIDDMVQLANFFNSCISAGYLDVHTDFKWIRERLGLPEAQPDAQIGQAPPGDGSNVPGQLGQGQVPGGEHGKPGGGPIPVEGSGASMYKPASIDPVAQQSAAKTRAQSATISVETSF